MDLEKDNRYKYNFPFVICLVQEEYEPHVEMNFVFLRMTVFPIFKRALKPLALNKDLWDINVTKQ